mgnify:CR=1 FL=1
MPRRRPELELQSDGGSTTGYVLQNNVFSDLMVTATSLALGLILGFVFVRLAARVLFWLCCCGGKCCSPPKEAAVADEASALARWSAGAPGVSSTPKSSSPSPLQPKTGIPVSASAAATPACVL